MSLCRMTFHVAAYLKPILVQVHAYVALPGGRTGYLSELRSGSEVLVADAGGRTRTALVGRAKIERRPLLLVEVSGPCGWGGASSGSAEMLYGSAAWCIARRLSWSSWASTSLLRPI